MALADELWQKGGRLIECNQINEGLKYLQESIEADFENPERWYSRRLRKHYKYCR